MFKSTKPFRKVVFVLIIILLLLSLSQVFAAGITVGENCTLAQAIASANADTSPSGSSCVAGSGADIITLTADITLAQALPQITSEIKIEGAGYAISGSDTYQIFDVGAAGDLTINNAVITKGAAEIGGGIAVNSGSLTVTDSAFSNNSAIVGGGIAISDGVAIITNSAFSNNSAVVGGGLIIYSGVVVITDSTVSSNTATQDGGGLSIHSGVVTITGSAISSNAAERDGGGLIVGGSLTMQNSTIASNSAPNGNGGGLYAIGSSIATLTHLTFFGNSSASAGGGGVHINQAAVHLRNSILYGSGGGDDCMGTLAQDEGNLIGRGNCSATALTSDPKLDALTGSPAYYPLQSDSPAIDAASSALCTTADQAGTPRPQEVACDIGAFEYIRPVAAAAQQLLAESTEDTFKPTKEPTPIPTPTPTSTPRPSTCLSMPNSGIVVSGFHNSTQCQRLDGGGIGIPSIINAGFIDAVDIWGYVLPGTQVCFRQSGGSFIFLDAETSPRTIIELSLSYRIEDSVSEMICTQIDRPGSVILR